ncbi:MAG: phage tail length tape measure family protein, partial [Burkholderiaceae bacterium]|nr:phage tail length tape measure family protein [Burkholderiaceae bacterium]
MSQAFVLSGKITLDPKAAVAGLDATQAALAETKAAVEGVDRAGAANLQTVVRVGAAHNVAAGQVGNLTAQFNDIGMMMMAGQNPLQLAVQQGTQISQVIGPMGAAGAATALKSAFFGMLSPISLMTLGTIALGASLVQWLTAAGDEARGLDDVLGDLDKSIKALRDGTRRTLDDMRADFGALTPEILEMERAFQELRIREVLLDAAEASKALSESMSGGFRSAAARLSNLFGADALGAITPAWDAVEGMTTALEMLGESTSLKDQLFWIDQLQGLIVNATGGVQNMTTEQAAFYEQTREAERALRAAAAATGDIAATDVAGGISRAADEARRLADELLAALGAAQSLASQGQTALREAQLKFEFKDDPVKLAGELAALRFNAATNGASPSSPEGMAIAMLRQEAVSAAEEVVRLDQAYAEWQRSQRSAAGGTEKQRSALADLIDAQMQELALLRETDPVQREMLKHREAMAAATDTERQLVEELIATRLREQEQMQALQETQDFFTGTLYDAFEGLILRGE